ncbi:hypothetical protein JNUCC64_30515 [Streptomyces sp. JNUCC 64]
MPPDRETAEACGAGDPEGIGTLPDLVGRFGALGYDLVQMALADQECWDRYRAAQWLTLRRWLDAHPDDELADEVRAELAADPLRYVRSVREHLGWGVFALTRR